MWTRDVKCEKDADDRHTLHVRSFVVEHRMKSIASTDIVDNMYGLRFEISLKVMNYVWI